MNNLESKTNERRRKCLIWVWTAGSLESYIEKYLAEIRTLWIGSRFFGHFGTCDKFRNRYKHHDPVSSNSIARWDVQLVVWSCWSILAMCLTKAQPFGNVLGVLLRKRCDWPNYQSCWTKSPYWRLIKVIFMWLCEARQVGIIVAVGFLLGKYVASCHVNACFVRCSESVWVSSLFFLLILGVLIGRA